MDDFYPMQSTPEPKANPFWPQLALSSVALIAAVVSTNVPEFKWLTYLTAIIFVISLVIMINESSVGSYVSSKWKQRKDNKVLSAYAKEYVEFIEQAKIIESLLKELNEVSRGENRPLCSYNPQNSLYHLENIINNIPSNVKVMFANSMLREIIQISESCLYYCDQLLRVGEYSFANEQQAKRIKKLLSKYEHFLEHHNATCTKINKQLSGVSITPIYGHELVFEWEKSRSSDIPA